MTYRARIVSSKRVVEAAFVDDELKLDILLIVEAEESRSEVLGRFAHAVFSSSPPHKL